jgi:hypothetical protein
MFDANHAKALVRSFHPEVVVEDCFPYKELYLVRVTHDDPDEADYDPFYSVNKNTGEVAEFSVITDGDPSEIAQAFANRKEVIE